MIKQFLAFLLVFVLVLGFTLQAHANLYNRGTDNQGNRLIYDSDLNITWYDYSSLALFDTWQEQVNWAATLDVNFGGIHYTDWRLPSTVDGPWFFGCDGTTTGGYNITSSEMGHLYYTELGNKGYYAINGTYPQPGWGLLNKGDFQNLWGDEGYWSGTDLSTQPDEAWTFHHGEGQQNRSHKTLSTGCCYAIAVRSGDVCMKPTEDTDNLWNIRHNADDRFHSNEAWLRPWRYNYEDGWGRWVGGYSYDLQWYDGPYTQCLNDLGGFSWNTSTSGSLHIYGAQDYQWHAWTYVYVDAPTSLSIPGSGDCVPTIFVNEEFDNPINLPGSINLTSGWNRVDITGYNQNDDYTFNLNYDLADYVQIMNSFVILPVRIVGINPVYFSSLQAAYDAAGDNDTIQLQDSLFPENLSIDDNKTIIIEGGYDLAYTSITGKTTVNGSMTISSGKVTIEGVQLW